MSGPAAGTIPQPIVVKSGNGGLVAGGLGLAALFGLYWFGVKPWLEKQKAGGDLKKEQASTVTAKPGKTLYDLNGKPIKAVNLSTIAADIHDTLEAWGPNDGKRVVRVFKSLPFGVPGDPTLYVRKLEQFYLERYGKNLKEHLVQELKDEDWINIKFWFK